MTTTFEPDARRRPPTPPDGPVRLAPPRRRARLPEAAVGAAVMIACSLAAVLWHMSATEKVPALALARSVARGEVVERDDLRVVYLAADEPVAHLGRDQAGSVVGRVAQADLPAGALLTSASVAAGVAVNRGEGVVGLALEPGQVPAAALVPGDVVNVIAGPAEAGEGTQVAPPALLASRAQVFAVEELGAQGRRLVSLKLAEADANRVAAAAERGPLRLVLVGR